MNMRRVLLFVLALSLLFSLSGCKLIVNTLSKVAESATTESPTETSSKPSSKATARPTEAKPADEGDDLVDPDTLQSMDGLDSYHMVQSGTFTDIDTDSIESTTVLNVEVWEVREPHASRMLWTTQKDDEAEVTMEIITIGSDTYMKTSDSDEWFTMSSSDPSNTSFGNMGWFTNPTTAMGNDGKFIGLETINGFRAKHYRYTGEAVVGSVVGIGGSIEIAQSDVWVSEEYNIIVKYESRWKGTADDGTESDWSYLSEVTLVNEPITIEPPEGVSKPGLPGDVPMMSGATDVNAFSGIVTFKVSASIAEVMDYYASALPDNGWEAGDDMGVEGMASFTKDGRSLTLMASEEDDATSVTILVQE